MSFCVNCGQGVTGRFCGSCGTGVGQPQVETPERVFHIAPGSIPTHLEVKAPYSQQTMNRLRYAAFGTILLTQLIAALYSWLPIYGPLNEQTDLLLLSFYALSYFVLLPSMVFAIGFAARSEGIRTIHPAWTLLTLLFIIAAIAVIDIAGLSTTLEDLAVLNVQDAVVLWVINTVVSLPLYIFIGYFAHSFRLAYSKSHMIPILRSSFRSIGAVVLALVLADAAFQTMDYIILTNPNPSTNLNKFVFFLGLFATLAPPNVAFAFDTKKSEE